MKAQEKKLVALGLAAVMAAGTTGCGAIGGTASAGSTTSESKVEVSSDDIWAAYDETVQISTVMPENNGIEWRGEDSYDSNPWYDAYKEKFNIEVTNDWVSNDYDTKLNLNIADGSIPDIFFVSGEQLQQLQEADQIWDLTEVYDKFASDTMKGYMEEEADTFETAKIDGKLYAIPQLSYGIIDQPNQVWIRTQWKDELGLADPTTMDELIEMAKAFQSKYGGYGITEDQSLESLKILAPAWGAHPDIWITDEDGKAVYGSVQPEMKDAVAAFAQMYQEGVINPDFATTDMTTMLQDVINGTVGINPFYQWWGYQPGPDVINNLGPEGIYEAYAIPSANGEEVKANIDFANYGYIVVSKKCQNPEAAIKLLNYYIYMKDEAQGQESQEFIDSLFNEGYSNIPYALRVINPNTDYNLFNGVKEALAEGEDTDVTDLGSGAVKYNNCVKWIQSKDANAIGDWSQMGNTKSAYSISKEMIDNDAIVKNVIWGNKPETLLSSGSTLDDILLEGFTKIIVGEQPIDYFDTLVEEWNKAGGEKATQEVNEMYIDK